MFYCISQKCHVAAFPDCSISWYNFDHVYFYISFLYVDINEWQLSTLSLTWLISSHVIVNLELCSIFSNMALSLNYKRTESSAKFQILLVFNVKVHRCNYVNSMDQRTKHCRTLWSNWVPRNERCVDLVSLRPTSYLP